MKTSIAKVMIDNEEVVFEGTVVGTSDDTVTLQLVGGGEVTLNKDELMEPIKDRIIQELPPKVVETKVVQKVVDKKLPALKAGGKLEQVVKLIKNNPGLSRKEYIAKIVETGIMTSLAGASTYHQNAKPYLNQ